MANVVIDIATQYTGNPAFKKATGDAQKLEKSVAKLGKQLASVFAASKVLAFGKASVKAFAEDEKAARSLALALANTGNAFAAIEVEKFIGDLQRATGVLDDNLRPAFRTLLTATGDVKKSQDGLALALDIAAGTGKDLSAVSMALAKAYGGQTTALSRLGAGLDKATLKTGDMDVILGQLTDKFKGQALAAAEGYSGSIAKLTVASQNAKEIIGKDLLDSMQMIAGKDGIGGAATAMEGFATQIGNAIYGIGVLTTKIKSLPGADFIGRFLSAATQVSGLGALSKFGASSKAASAGTPAQSPGQRKAIDKANADAIKVQKTKNTLSTIDNNNTARKLVLTGDQLALLELEKKFDVERIGLFAAMNQATDGETKMRLLSLIAIKDQNAALAGQIVNGNKAADALEAFRQALLGTIKALLEKTQAQLAALQESLGINAPSQSGVLTNPFNAGSARLGESAGNAAAGLPATGLSSMGFGDSHLSALGRQSVNNITINATGIGDQQIAAVVQNAIQDLNRYGNSTTYAGAI
jgi:hypothetical protein